MISQEMTKDWKNFLENRTSRLDTLERIIVKLVKTPIEPGEKLVWDNILSLVQDFKQATRNRLE